MLRSGSYVIPTLLAVVLHAIVVALLAQSWFEHEDVTRKVPRHVQAQIVDLKTQKALKKSASEAKARKKAEQLRKAEAEKKRIADAKRKATEEKRKVAEKKRKQEQVKKKAAEKKRQQEIANKNKAAAEKKRQAEIKKQKEIARKKATAEKKKKAEADKQRKAEAAKAKRLAEVKRRLEAEQNAKAQAETQRAQNQALEKAMAAEQAALQAEEERAAAMGYEDYIVDLITRNWRRSPSARNGMMVEVTIYLLASGRVNDRQVTKSSGDSRFDNDALRAIDRVGVFEKLQEMDPVLFDRYFRKRILRFRPEDLRN
ncbi:MAG: cell envelope integrity protein TolA [Neptuniibacter sp.]